MSIQVTKSTGNAEEVGRRFAIFAKMNRNDERVDAYRNQLSPELQARFDELKAMFRRAAPEAEESWSYSMPALRLNKRILLNFAVWKNHCGIYPGAAVISRLQEVFPMLQYSKGTCLFPHDQPIPIEVVQKAITLGKERVRG